MNRLLDAETVRETLKELGIRPAAYAIESRGRRLSLVNRRGENRLVDLTINVGESESAVIARIGDACRCEVPEFLDI